MKFLPLMLISCIFSPHRLDEDIWLQLGFILKRHDLTNALNTIPEADLLLLPIRADQSESSIDITLLAIKPNALRSFTCTFDEQGDVRVGDFTDIRKLAPSTVKSINMTEASCECVRVLHRREYVTEEFLATLFNGNDIQSIG